MTVAIDQTKINEKMHKLETVIGYSFSDISHLAEAMKAIREDKETGNKEYTNEALACFGDTIIKCLIAQHLYKLGKKKGEITTEKAKLETNKVFNSVAKKFNIPDYAYHEKHFAKDAPGYEKVCSKGHDPYIEAIAAAIYLDGGWEKAGKWFEKWLLPKLEESKDKGGNLQKNA